MKIERDDTVLDDRWKGIPGGTTGLPIADVAKQGWNLLLVKVGNGSGDWGLIARFTTPNGRPIRELKYSTDVPEELKK